MENGLMVSIVIALSEFFKRTGIVKASHIPLANLVMGIIFSVAYNGTDYKSAIFSGIIIGLVSTGLYSGVKNYIRGG